MDYVRAWQCARHFIVSRANFDNLELQWNLSIASMLYSGHFSIADTIFWNQWPTSHWNLPRHSGHLSIADTFLENRYQFPLLRDSTDQIKRQSAYSNIILLSVLHAELHRFLKRWTRVLNITLTISESKIMECIWQDNANCSALFSFSPLICCPTCKWKSRIGKMSNGFDIFF